MKKFVIICLLAAIGAVTFIAKGEARSIQEFCMQNPDLPECLPYVARLHRQTPLPPPPASPEKFPTGPAPIVVDHGPPPPDFQPDYGRRHRDGFDAQFGFGNRDENRFGFDNGQGNFCGRFAFRLRAQGWQRVRALRCSGPSFVYQAWRDGQTMTLLVSPNSGRIRKIIPTN